MNSIPERFGINLAGNLIKAFLVFVTGLLIARTLGPEDYGYFAFLLASFVAVRALFDMGTSNAFFTFVSKEPREKKFFLYYFLWICAQFLIPIILIVSLSNNWLISVWKGGELELIIAAFIASFMQFTLWGFIAQLGESQRLTKKVQLINITVAMSHLLAVLVVILLGYKSLFILYTLVALEFLLAFIYVLSTWRKIIVFNVADSQLSAKGFFKEFYKYCRPLFLYTWVMCGYIFADAWMLQHYAGSVQQAYFSVALQVATISLLATTSILRVLWKEIAEEAHRGNLERVKRLYFNTCRWLFFFAAMISGFLVPWAADIIDVTLGEEYMMGVTVLTVMFFYPVHQALGQVVSSMYLALEMTISYARLGVVSMLVSVIVTYFVLVPSDKSIIGFGLDLGAIGLALKMVFLQFLSVNLYIWFLCKKQNWQYQFKYQIYILMLTVMAGYFSFYAVTFFWQTEGLRVLMFFLSGGVYLVCIGTGVWFISKPLLGVSQFELSQLWPRIFKSRRTL